MWGLIALALAAGAILVTLAMNRRELGAKQKSKE